MPVLDTDLLINYLRKHPKAVKLISSLIESGEPLKTTIFNVCELYKGAYMSSNVPRSIRNISDWLKHFQIISFMRNDANINGQISVDLRRRGLHIGDFNELIATLIITNEEILITRNIKHYNRVPRIALQTWEL